ncbi:VWA domain-containing protein [Candidatus Woesearchaeota archaeon]|nr:VWA domain-containing protein [Candidatus Woesearchaeota archaeon]
MIYPDVSVDIDEFSSAEELQGKLSLSQDQKLMHSVLENDQDTIDEGKVLKESINLGIGSFTPDLMFENLVNDYQNAEKLYGQKIIHFLTGYDPGYVDRNIQIPEFQRELKKRVNDNIDKLKHLQLIDDNGIVTDKGLELASICLYIEELDNMVPKGIQGEQYHKKQSLYGGKQDVKTFKKSDRYRDIAIKRSVTTAIRRSHKDILVHDLKSFERESRGSIYIVYAMDASGSMKDKKIDTAKKAGIALAFKAIEAKNNVGLITFGSEIKTRIDPCTDFVLLLKSIAAARASGETNIINVLEKSLEMFKEENVTRHLILLTDALPTVGTEEETLKVLGKVRAAGITVSLIGISLDPKGEELAKKIVEFGDGRLYIVKDLENLDKIVLEDYYETQ